LDIAARPAYIPNATSILLLEIATDEICKESSRKWEIEQIFLDISKSIIAMTWGMAQALALAALDA
jgi:hypothetical protein